MLAPGDVLWEVAAADACPRLWSGSAVGQLSLCLLREPVSQGAVSPPRVAVLPGTTLGRSLAPPSPLPAAAALSRLRGAAQRVTAASWHRHSCSPNAP